jgi:hypothetical protein
LTRALTGADEKMFRAVRDRERWFQAALGQKFEFDVATSDQILAANSAVRGLICDIWVDAPSRH